MHDGHGTDMIHGPAWLANESVETLQAVLTPIPPVNSLPDIADKWRAAQELAMDPVYQLK